MHEISELNVTSFIQLATQINPQITLTERSHANDFSHTMSD